MTQLAFLLINPSAWNLAGEHLCHGLADRPHHGRGAGAWQPSVLPGLRWGPCSDLVWFRASSDHKQRDPEDHAAMIRTCNVCSQ